MTKNANKMIALCWKDKQQVFMLSTAHTSKMTQQKNRKTTKPKMIVEYNKHMGAVNKCDMQLSFTETIRKCMKWYKKLFAHFVDLTVYNAHILYKPTTM